MNKKSISCCEKHCFDIEIHPNRWYRRSLTKTKFHRVQDVGGEAQMMTIETKCGLSIPANDGTKSLVDWAISPHFSQRCKKCASFPERPVSPKRPHKIIWAAAINLNGCWGPNKMVYNEECETYYDKDGDFSVEDTGLIIRDSIITYANTEKAFVQLWIDAVIATMDFIKRRLTYYGGDK